jgi:pyruvate/2-oxoglutarate/acetoin dehydrogenase E1 component
MNRVLLFHIATYILAFSLLAQPVCNSFIFSPTAEQLEETSKAEEMTEVISQRRQKEITHKSIIPPVKKTWRTVTFKHTLPQLIYSATKRFLVLQVFRL